MSSLLDMDPNILVSMVNMKLRDFYSSIDDLCDDLDENKEEIDNILDLFNEDLQLENITEVATDIT